MFAISTGSIFKVDSYACTAVAISSVACGLGIACDVWFLFRYSWVDLRTFIVSSTSPTPTPHKLILWPNRPVPMTYLVHTSSSRYPHACPPSAH